MPSIEEAFKHLGPALRHDLDGHIDCGACSLARALALAVLEEAEQQSAQMIDIVLADRELAERVSPITMHELRARIEALG